MPAPAASDNCYLIVEREVFWIVHIVAPEDDLANLIIERSTALYVDFSNLA